VTEGLSRREWLVAAGGLAALVPARRAAAADYASAAEALSSIEGFEAAVHGLLQRLHLAIPAARRMVESFRRDRERHREHRARVRRRLGLAAPAATAPAESAEAPLSALREAQSALVYAHAEALPTLHDSVSVGLLMADMVDLARHLTVIDLWIEAEAARG
jgi:hypothetical protein